jgi:hypothetical protein
VNRASSFDGSDFIALLSRAHPERPLVAWSGQYTNQGAFMAELGGGRRLRPTAGRV